MPVAKRGGLQDTYAGSNTVYAVRNGAGAKVMTPGIWRSFLADLYQTVFIGEKNWRQDFEGYKSSIHVEVKSGNKTRLEYIHQPVRVRAQRNRFDRHNGIPPAPRLLIANVR